MSDVLQKCIFNPYAAAHVSTYTMPFWECRAGFNPLAASNLSNIARTLKKLSSLKVNPNPLLEIKLLILLWWVGIQIRAFSKFYSKNDYVFFLAYYILYLP